jgi:ribosomal protein L16 Arg81 hydroxylase
LAADTSAAQRDEFLTSMTHEETQTISIPDADLPGISDLDGILYPLTRKEFFRAYYGKTYAYIQGERGRFSSLLPWSALNSILENPRLAQQIKLFREGKTIPAGAYEVNGVISCGKLTELLRGGATLHVVGIDEVSRPIRIQARKLAQIFQCRVSTNLYAAWRVANGFGVHWDNHDVFALQIHGKKEWKIYGEGSVRFPLRNGTASEKLRHPSEPVWQGNLNPGDVLYIPKGWWHVASPCDEPTVHLTIGISPPRGMEFITWLGFKLSEHECIRRDIPLFSGAEEQELFLREVRRIVNEALDSDLLHAFLESRRTNSGRPLFGLPYSVVARTIAESGDRCMSLAVPYFLEPQESSAGQLILCVEGREYMFAKSTAPLFEALNSGRTPSVAEFYQLWQNLFTSEELTGFITTLVESGAVMLTEPENRRDTGQL